MILITQPEPSRAGADVDGQRVAHAPPGRERPERPDPRVVAELVHHGALGSDAAGSTRREREQRRRSAAPMGEHDRHHRADARLEPLARQGLERDREAHDRAYASVALGLQEREGSTRVRRRERRVDARGPTPRARPRSRGRSRGRLRGRGWSCHRRALRADAGRRAPRRTRLRRRAASATPGPGCTRDRSRGRRPRSSVERSAPETPPVASSPPALRIAAMAERSLSTSGPPASSARYFVSIGHVAWMPRSRSARASAGAAATAVAVRRSCTNTTDCVRPAGASPR